MKRTRDNRSDDSSQVPMLNVYRVNRKLCAGDVSIHEAAGAAFSLWRDLRRQFPSHSLLKSDVAALLRQHVPIQAVRVHKRWQIFGGFEAYAELQSLPSPNTRVRVEIQEFRKISREQIESLSLALPLHYIEMYSLCGEVAEEQLRTCVKTRFSAAAQEVALACDMNSQIAFASSLGRSVDFLKRQAARLKPRNTPGADFLSDILEKAHSEKQH